MGILLRAPTVESLVDDQHTQRVAGIEEGPRGGVVRGTDEVEASLLHQPHLADLSIVEGHRPKDAVVVMHAGSVDKQRLAIEHETLLSIERKGANAEFS